MNLVNNNRRIVSMFDSSIVGLELINDSLILTFDEYGFWKKQGNEPFKRITNKQIKLLNVPKEEVSAKVYEPKIFNDKTYICEETISLNKLIKKIRLKEVSFSIVQDYYYECGVLLEGSLRSKRKKMSIKLIIPYESLIVV